MIVLGIVGQSGAGKSTVSAMLSERGAACLDMDCVARDIVAPGSEILRRIEQSFGTDCILPDGSLDRRRLGRHVFSDPKALALLNSITHPALVEAAREWLGELRASASPPRVAVIDAAVLFESGLVELVDCVVAVVATPEVQAQRIAARDGISLEEACARVAAQAPVGEMLSRADHVIVSDGPLDDTRRQVDELWARCTPA